jgi:hypothetical protein
VVSCGLADFVMAVRENQRLMIAVTELTSPLGELWRLLPWTMDLGF